MKYSFTTKLLNLLIFILLGVGFGALGIYFAFYVSPYFITSGSGNANAAASLVTAAQKFNTKFSYNFAANFATLGIAGLLLAVAGLVLSIKSIGRRGKDEDVRNAFLCYIAMGYVVAIWALANAMVYYHLIGMSQIAFWIVVFVIVAIGAMVGANVPMVKMLEDKNQNIILAIITGVIMVLSIGYLCSALPTYLITRATSGYYQRFLKGLELRVIHVAIAGFLSLVAFIFHVVDAKANRVRILPQVIGSLSLLPFAGAFMGAGVQEWIYHTTNRFSLQGVKGAYAGGDYVIMVEVFGAIFAIIGVVSLLSVFLPDNGKKKGELTA